MNNSRLALRGARSARPIPCARRRSDASVVARGHPNQGARGSSAYARHRVLLQPRDGCQGLVEAVASDHLECHFADSPSLVIEGLDDGGHSHAVPCPEQPTCRPDAEPVRRTGSFTRDSPTRRWATQGEDQLRVCVTVVEQLDATSNHLSFAAPVALLLDAFPWRLAPRRSRSHRLRVAACSTLPSESQPACQWRRTSSARALSFLASFFLSAASSYARSRSSNASISSLGKMS